MTLIRVSTTVPRPKTVEILDIQTNERGIGIPLSVNQPWFHDSGETKKPGKGHRKIELKDPPQSGALLLNASVKDKYVVTLQGCFDLAASIMVCSTCNSIYTSPRARPHEEIED
ncbi:Uncharacterized protein APZ42_027849 [Daphnia magna]|uniref:Uncharacterized protein n=1 Tax=Daphnia magna TaxID=35525 RepID=A0A164R0X1_9CRUS|nr:Uncharacterized protein APZ42_027849 [Daphnia magna]